MERTGHLSERDLSTLEDIIGHVCPMLNNKINEFKALRGNKITNGKTIILIIPLGSASSLQAFTDKSPFSKLLLTVAHLLVTIATIRRCLVQRHAPLCDSCPTNKSQQPPATRINPFFLNNWQLSLNHH